jgi:hypothetical protein
MRFWQVLSSPETSATVRRTLKPPYGDDTNRLTKPACVQISSLLHARRHPHKYTNILATLNNLRKLVQTEGFVALGLTYLDLVYRKTPGLDGRSLRITFGDFQKEQEAGDGALQESNRGSFVKDLDLEIESFERLARLTQERVERLTEPMKDAQLLPGQKDLRKIMRYEAALERQFEHKLQQLVAWRREKGAGGEKEAAQGPAGGQDEVL